MVEVIPLQARRFAEAIGRRAKTDAIDAAMLARFGALDALQAMAMVSHTLSDMKGWVEDTRLCRPPGYSEQELLDRDLTALSSWFAGHNLSEMRKVRSLSPV